jgi:oligopeptide/dipeptide ABC transporter ATP-binding protein
MYLGRIVEIGSTQTVLESPTHPYTQALLSVIPVPNPRQRRRHTILEGDPPNAIELPKGCRFYPRCPAAFEDCRRIDPGLMAVGEGHQAACLLVDSREFHRAGC